jgi:hypothetical protein
LALRRSVRPPDPAGGSMTRTTSDHLASSGSRSTSRFFDRRKKPSFRVLPFPFGTTAR